MGKSILVFGASSSKQSINKQLAAYAASLVSDVQINLIDLNDFEMPLFSVDKEAELGVPDEAHRFKKLIKNADGIIISLAEHNGSYSVAYKNLYDWVSRIEKEFWYSKPLLLLATSPGPRGGKTVLDIATQAYSYTNKKLVGSFSLPSFHSNYDKEKGIVDTGLAQELNEKIALFKQAL
ncbi:NADPH-dependent FMN reductase [Carboxylicivirga sp. M1479]|uniref:NADPH-dependent FMN reductase n=1 Tax=Carboxylicivirga sp. M1479 TaxID=2594476 RepID=UPI001177E0B4|nr:NAD(P)H-dependent oxidoreductase [Carboxylicivirga sp. M1479]TRX70941.1 NAD(P)H-dependent oxidoreductase [Carboxylicivirga sp. M1479]